MKILVAGDYVPIGRFDRCLYDGSYDCGAIKSITEKVDYSILNFEAPIVNDFTTGIRKSGPHLKVNSNSINAVKWMGFNAVTLANNHFRDYGQHGVETTINELKKNNIDFVGAGLNINEASKPLFKEFKNRTLSIINFCENEFSVATDSRGGSMPLDIPCNYHQIIEAKQKSDFVLIIVHGGHEGYQLPSPRMKKLYRLLVEFGADAVVNHHQHCYSGYEFYKGKPIIYGLGNFIFDWKGKRKDIWNEGYMVIINFNDIIDIELIPYKQCDENAGAFILGDSRQFLEKTSVLNAIISDDQKLEEEFGKFVQRKGKGVLATLSPFSNKYLMALVSRGYLPSFVSSRKSTMLYDYVSCEAHRDVTLDSLRSIFED